MFTVTLNGNSRLLTKVEKQEPGDEWSTRLKNVEIGGNNISEASVTVIHGLENDLVDLNGTLYKFNEEGALIIVFADDTEQCFGTVVLDDAIKFANDLVKLLSTPDKIS